MTLDHQKHPVALESRAYLSLLVSPMHWLLNAPVTTATWVNEQITNRRYLLEENASLKAEQMAMQAQLQKMAALETENRRLRELMDSAFNVADQLLIAELIAVSPDPFSHQIIINKGKKDQIYPNQPLLDAYGIVGQIIDSDPLTSRALLITDVSHGISVQVNRNGVRAVAVGTGSVQELELLHVPDTTDIKVGDLLVTSGLDGRFPSGYPVGQVTEVKHDPGHHFAQIKAKPSARLDRIREVLVIWPGEKHPAPQEAEEQSSDPKQSDPVDLDKNDTLASWQ